ncbi:MAG TPA: FAD-dependent oxidoreductase, partial [Acidiferrobacteraceae bacterium]|nr:FAD-dependent oxidoreductase [Acidiferrobacteraceae bacterium]
MDGDFDLIVLGGGSGGIAAANRAAGYGARVALIERNALGGTCVNRGCVPKKILWSAASLHAQIRHADPTIHAGHTTLQWPALVAARDAYIARLNGRYEDKLRANGVTLIRG